MAKANTTEIALDIIAFASICIKMGFEESVNNGKLFTEMVNEAGFRTARGEEFTYMGLRQMMRRLPEDVKNAAVSEMRANEISFDYVGAAQAWDAAEAEDE